MYTQLLYNQLYFKSKIPNTMYSDGIKTAHTSVWLNMHYLTQFFSNRSLKTLHVQQHVASAKHENIIQVLIMTTEW